MVGIPYLGARNPHCPEYPLIHEILVGIPSSGDSVQWGFRPVGIPGGNPNCFIVLFRDIYVRRTHIIKVVVLFIKIEIYELNQKPQAVESAF